METVITRLSNNLERITMISDLSSTLAVVMLGTPVLLFVMLLPAILELKKPKDAGPRVIMTDFFKVLPAPAAKVRSLLDLEEHSEMEIALKPSIDVVLGSLQCLDA